MFDIDKFIEEYGITLDDDEPQEEPEEVTVYRETKQGT